MSPRCCLYTTQLYIRRLCNNHQGCLTRELRNPASELRNGGPGSFDQPNYSYERLKVGKLHILALKVMRHICSPNLLILLVRLFTYTGITASSVPIAYGLRRVPFTLKLWFILYVLRTIRITLPPQQLNLYLR